MDLPANKPSIDRPPSLEENGVWNREIGSKIIRFKDLARCGEEIWIEHEGKLYRLQSTRQGKLVLTK